MIANLDLGKILTEYFLLTMGSLILAVNFDLFLAPFNIAPGGTSGAAIIIHEFTGWPKGLTMLVLTLPMLVIGFFFLGTISFSHPGLLCHFDIQPGRRRIGGGSPGRCNQRSAAQCPLWRDRGGARHRPDLSGRHLPGRHIGYQPGDSNEDRHSQQPGVYADRRRGDPDCRTGLWLGNGYVCLCYLIYLGICCRLCPGGVPVLSAPFLS